MQDTSGGKENLVCGIDPKRLLFRTPFATTLIFGAVKILPHLLQLSRDWITMKRYLPPIGLLR